LFQQSFKAESDEFDRFIRPDEGPVTLKLGSEIPAKVNRTAQPNGAARILGRKKLAEWFQNNFEPMDIVSVDLSSRKIIVPDAKAGEDKPFQPAHASASKAPPPHDTQADGDRPSQRRGAESNTRVGREFQASVEDFFTRLGWFLTPSIVVQIGISGKKSHAFDLGNVKDKILLECKAHKWTEGNNVPSAKLSVWNEAMFFFYVAPRGYRKLLVVLKDFSAKRNETLGEFYVRTCSHLIPDDVEVWEYDESRKDCNRIK
jgi:hypothetical protein